MLDDRGHEMPAFPIAREERTLQREVVGFAAAAREYDLLRCASEQTSHLTARGVHHVPGGRSRPMQTGRISESVIDGRAHRVGNFWCDRRACVVIEVDALHNSEHQHLIWRVVQDEKHLHGMLASGFGFVTGFVVTAARSRISRATIVPDAKVSAATEPIAHAKPKKSAMSPAASAPIA
ncbi:MAG: hypothetical protein WD795_03610 [Woeseia sp.]